MTATAPFSAPTDAPTPVWVQDMSAWMWDDQDGAWMRGLSRRVGDEVSGVLLSTAQTVRADGEVVTAEAELVVPGIVYVEELDALIDALTAARELLRR